MCNPERAAAAAVLPVLEGEKRCTKCGLPKALDAFHAHKGSLDGRAWECKQCAGVRARAYYEAHKDVAIVRAVTRSRTPEAKAWQHAYYLAHKQEKSAYDRAYRAAHAARIAARQAAYRALHAEEDRRKSLAYAASHRAEAVARAAAWQRAHPERVATRGQRYNERHPEKRRLRRLRRRARAHGAPGTLSAADVRLLHEVQAGRCAYCLTALGESFHRDHMTPLGPTGAHAIENVALACARCNTRKGARCAGQFLALLLKERRLHYGVMQ